MYGPPHPLQPIVTVRGSPTVTPTRFHPRVCLQALTWALGLPGLTINQELCNHTRPGILQARFGTQTLSCVAELSFYLLNH